jgi:NAD(P)-dependent dehydrogenase (short-subunit alcohol dehydrogenase family)
MKTWLITGVSRGLGRALAIAALARGDKVIGTARSADAWPVGAAERSLHLISLELTDGAAIEASVERAFALVPRIDVIVNNAGYGLVGPIEDASDEDVERLFAINLFAPFKLIRAVLPRLRAQGHGHIINVTSVAAYAPVAGTGLYAASKAAMEALSHTLAQEVSPFGIRVTAVAPGTLRTDFFSGHSLARTDKPVGGDYSTTVGVTIGRFDSGRQTGDPARAAEAILTIVDAPNPPLHLLLGSDALDRASTATDVHRAEVDVWSGLTRSSDAVPEAEAVAGA